MNSQITENKIAGIFHGDDELTEAYQSMIDEAVPNTPELALKAMFNSKIFKGLVPGKDLDIVFKKGSQWDKLFGVDKVKTAWKKLQADKVVTQMGPNFRWNG